MRGCSIEQAGQGRCVRRKSMPARRRPTTSNAHKTPLASAPFERDDRALSRQCVPNALLSCAYGRYPKLAAVDQYRTYPMWPRIANATGGRTRDRDDPDGRENRSETRSWGLNDFRETAIWDANSGTLACGMELPNTGAMSDARDLTHLRQIGRAH